MIKILDRYIFKQVLGASIVCLLLFVVVWIAPETLFKVIKHVLEGAYTPKVGVELLVCELPKILSKALPVGMLLGSLFVFDKLSKDFELTVMRSVGLSFWRILVPVIVLSMFFTGLCFVVYDKWVPVSSTKLKALKQEYDSSHFVYAINRENDLPKQAVIISDYDQNHIRDLKVLDFADTNQEETSIIKDIMIADYANIVNDGWNLKNVRKYKIDKQGVFENIEDVDTVKIFDKATSDKVFNLMVNSLKRDREFTNEQLVEYIKLLKSENLNEESNFMLNKYLQRYFHSLICVLFAILGCLLGFSQPREQRLIGFTIAIAIIFAYYITLPFFDLLAEKSVLPPLVSASIQPIAIAIFIYFLKKAKDL